ncbi:MAG: hypothetical protein R2729_21920 [Bryobacteraceae bacterium]
MRATLVPWAAVCLWELGLAAFCFACLRRVPPGAFRVAMLLALNIAVSSACAAVLSFLGWNHPAAYLLLALAFLGAGARDARRRGLPRFEAPRLKSAAPWFVLGAMLALCVRPIEEVDSLYNLHYVMGWVQNRTTPYTFAYNYVPFWELSVAPQLVLAGGDWFLWFQSLKAIALLAVALLLIARELAMPDRLAAWAIVSVMLFPHLWLGPSGVATIKNDMIQAAGAALVALVAMRAARGVAGRVDVAAAALAAVFFSVKFSGPALMIVGGAVVAAAGWRWIATHAKTACLAGAAVGTVWFLLAGHYFLHNFLLHGNPVYPYTIRIGPIHLPGLADQSATSILYNLGNPRLWRLLFLPENGLSPAGLLFPVAMPAILLGSVALAANALLRRRVTPLSALGLIQLVFWLVYFRSNYSASAGANGDLIFLENDLGSLRYVEGPLLMGELALVGILHRLRIPSPVILALLAAHAASCVMETQERAFDHPWLLIAGCGAALAVSAQAIRGRAAIPAAATLLALSLLAGTYLLERRRPTWLLPLQPLYLRLYDAPAEDLFYLVTDEYSQQPCWHFPLLGRHLQHSAASGPLSALRGLPAPSRHVAWTRPQPNAPAPAIPGYAVIVDSEKGVLYARSGP